MKNIKIKTERKRRSKFLTFFLVLDLVRSSKLCITRSYCFISLLIMPKHIFAVHYLGLKKVTK